MTHYILYLTHLATNNNMEIYETCGIFIGLIKSNLGTARRSYITAPTMFSLIEQATKETDPITMPVLKLDIKTKK